MQPSVKKKENTEKKKEKEKEEEEELLQSESPKEMGDATMGNMERDQMQDWLDKWDGGPPASQTTGQAGNGVDDLI